MQSQLVAATAPTLPLTHTLTHTHADTPSQSANSTVESSATVTAGIFFFSGWWGEGGHLWCRIRQLKLQTSNSDGNSGGKTYLSLKKKPFLSASQCEDGRPASTVSSQSLPDSRQKQVQSHFLSHSSTINYENSFIPFFFNL